MCLAGFIEKQEELEEFNNLEKLISRKGTFSALKLCYKTPILGVFVKKS